MSSPDRIAFESSGDFMRETRRDVEAYLAHGSLRRVGFVKLHIKAPVAVGLVVLSWALLMFGSPGHMLTPLLFVGLALGAMLTGFCIQHDANHGASFRSKRYNHLLGWTADALLGYSSYAWRVKHNVAHHTYTNIDGHDDDITQMPLARLVPSQGVRPWYRFQHIYIWVLYSLMTLRLQTFGDITAFRRGSIGRSALHVPRRWDLAAFIFGKLIFFGWTLVIPLLLYPWWVVLLSFVGFSLVLSLIMAVTFQLAHCVEGTTSASAEEMRTEKRVWAVHQVEATADFCPSNPALTWFLGGLNYQIEHHPFPGIPHTHYPQIAHIVRRAAVKHGVHYTVHASLCGALRSHARYIRSMGKQGLAVDLEMG